MNVFGGPQYTAMHRLWAWQPYEEGGLALDLNPVQVPLPVCIPQVQV